MCYRDSPDWNEQHHEPVYNWKYNDILNVLIRCWKFTGAQTALTVSEKQKQLVRVLLTAMWLTQ